LQRLLTRRALDLEPDRDIVDSGLPGKQRIGLEEITGIPVQACKRLVEDLDRSAGRLQQPGGDVQQCRFPATGQPTMATNSPSSTDSRALSTAV
jgi:hypothetical protein